MKITANCNMYKTSAGFVWQTFGNFLSGNRTGCWCVVSERPLGKSAHSALESSAEARGFGKDACTFVTLTPAASNGKQVDHVSAANEQESKGQNNVESKRVHGAGEDSVNELHKTGERSTLVGETTGTLPAQNLFTVIEGIDPVAVVATDSQSVHVLAEAYRQSIPLDQSCRLFGRDAVAFRSFEPLLTTSENKQKAWALLKKLPRFDQT